MSSAAEKWPVSYYGRKLGRFWREKRQFPEPSILVDSHPVGGERMFGTSSIREQRKGIMGPPERVARPAGALLRNGAW